MPTEAKSSHRWELKLNEAEQSTLQEAVRHHPRAAVRERCAALLKIAAGHSPHWVALHGLLVRRDPDSVYSWLRHYQQEGLLGVLGHRHGGARRRRLRRP